MPQQPSESASNATSSNASTGRSRFSQRSVWRRATTRTAQSLSAPTTEPGGCAELLPGLLQAPNHNEPTELLKANVAGDQQQSSPSSNCKVPLMNTPQLQQLIDEVNEARGNSRSQAEPPHTDRTASLPLDTVGSRPNYSQPRPNFPILPIQQQSSRAEGSASNAESGRCIPEAKIHVKVNAQEPEPVYRASQTRAHTSETERSSHTPHSRSNASEKQPNPLHSRPESNTSSKGVERNTHTQYTTEAKLYSHTSPPVHQAEQQKTQALTQSSGHINEHIPPTKQHLKQEPPQKKRTKKTQPEVHEPISTRTRIMAIFDPFSRMIRFLCHILRYIWSLFCTVMSLTLKPRCLGLLAWILSCTIVIACVCYFIKSLSHLPPPLGMSSLATAYSFIMRRYSNAVADGFRELPRVGIYEPPKHGGILEGLSAQSYVLRQALTNILTLPDELLPEFKQTTLAMKVAQSDFSKTISSYEACHRDWSNQVLSFTYQISHHNTSIEQHISSSKRDKDGASNVAWFSWLHRGSELEGQSVAVLVHSKGLREDLQHFGDDLGNSVVCFESVLFDLKVVRDQLRSSLGAVQAKLGQFTDPNAARGRNTHGIPKLHSIGLTLHISGLIVGEAREVLSQKMKELELEADILKRITEAINKSEEGLRKMGNARGSEKGARDGLLSHMRSNVELLLERFG
ncbi:hypothetical protein G7046_g6775 [Stylonectria norvegica]|nr:hypothetical protein G7046_g6775 [Stylonectria norvegica]